MGASSSNIYFPTRTTEEYLNISHTFLRVNFQGFCCQLLYIQLAYISEPTRVCYRLSGCPLGEVHSQVVPRHELVRIMSGEPAEWCHKTCRCGSRGSLHRCTEVTCSSRNQCYPQHAPGMISSTSHILRKFPRNTV